MATLALKACFLAVAMVVAGCAGPGVYYGSSPTTPLSAGKVWLDDSADALRLTVITCDIVSALGERRAYNVAKYHAEVSGLSSERPLVLAVGPYSPLALRWPAFPSLVGFDAAGSDLPPPTTPIDDERNGPRQSESVRVGSLFTDWTGRLFRLESVDDQGRCTLSAWGDSRGDGAAVIVQSQKDRAKVLVGSDSGARRVVRVGDGPEIAIDRGLQSDDPWLTEAVRDWKGRADHQGWFGSLSADGNLLVGWSNSTTLAYRRPNTAPIPLGTPAYLADRGPDVTVYQENVVLLSNRVVYSAGGEQIAELNERMRKPPPEVRREWLSERFADDGVHILLAAVDFGGSTGPLLSVLRWNWQTGDTEAYSLALSDVLKAARLPVQPAGRGAGCDWYEAVKAAALSDGRGADDDFAAGGDNCDGGVHGRVHGNGVPHRSGQTNRVQ